MAIPLRTVFMGTPQFAVPSLKLLSSRPDIVNLVGVYTQPDRPAGRGQKVKKPEIKILAEELGLPIFQPANINLPEEKRALADLMPDVVIVVAYAQFLSNAILNTPRLGCINVHSSLLPKYRGAAPIQYAIWNGDKVSGVSTMRLISKMDAGPILLQKSIPIHDEMTTVELHNELAELGSKVLIETLESLRERKITEVPQDERLVTFAPEIKKEQGLLDWQLTGKELLQQMRAFVPWPGTFTYSNRGILKIHKAKFKESVFNASTQSSPGEIIINESGVFIKCQDGWLELLQVQLEGKREMSVNEFLNGLRNNSDFFLTKVRQGV